ncbi:tricarboxylate carrier protein [Cyclospora cayetanensis]|uniref:Tricarboxylate carrier protein n=1 Tax=Cyclospora cayetanensis TaxID=88456 RepID=A0A1D3D1C2_9EIME|nr:tricarboxylate carrier protein [Cyclospora cayetanensis]
MHSLKTASETTEMAKTDPTMSEDAPMQAKAHSLDTYWGRVRSFQQRMNPLLLFATRTEIESAKEVAALADAGNWSALRSRGVTEEMLQSKVLLRDASVNHSNGNVLHPLFRLAAFAPVNIPICAGMLLTAPTAANSVFWQWVNQTYNAAFNYANGNRLDDEKQKEEKKTDVLKGYRHAKAEHCSLHGIPVFSESGRPLGVSKRAGFEAVMQTAVSRFVLPIPVLLFPSPVISFFSMALPVTQSNAFLRVLTQLSVIYGCLNVGLPMAVGIFPSTVKIAASELEPQFHDLKDSDGTPVTHVIFNPFLCPAVLGAITELIRMMFNLEQHRQQQDRARHRGQQVVAADARGSECNRICAAAPDVDESPSSSHRI